MEVWENAGINRTMYPHLIYRGAKACVCIYDVTDSSTLYCLAYWIAEAKKWVDCDFFVVIGNKADLGENRDVEKETVETFRKEKSCTQRFEVSAKTGDGVREAFQAIADQLVEKYGTGSDRRTTIQLAQSDQKGARSNGSGCCQ